MKKTDHIIWSDQIDYEDWRKDMECEYPGKNEQWRIDRAYEINDSYLTTNGVILIFSFPAPFLLSRILVYGMGA